MYSSDLRDNNWRGQAADMLLDHRRLLHARPHVRRSSDYGRICGVYGVPCVDGLVCYFRFHAYQETCAGRIEDFWEISNGGKRWFPRYVRSIAPCLLSALFRAVLDLLGQIPLYHTVYCLPLVFQYLIFDIHHLYVHNTSQSKWSPSFDERSSSGLPKTLLK